MYVALRLFCEQHMDKMKVGLIGCGNIGADLCIALQRGLIPAQIAALTDMDDERARLLQRTFNLNASICDLEENAQESDILFECAAPEAVRDIVEVGAAHHRDCLVMSVGGLMENPGLFGLARDANIRIWIPSGALCGLDGIRSAVEAGLHTVILTTRKPPTAIDGTEYLLEKGIDLSSLKEPKVVFQGSAREACKAFPKNVNVAAALSFAGIGPDETKVRVIADPKATVNVHEIFAEGAFGQLTTVTQNLPSPRNPKSSYLASLSAIAELRMIAEVFVAHQRVQRA